MIGNEILILDDVLSKTYVQHIERTVLDGITPWFLLRDITNGSENSKEGNYGFTHFLGSSQTSDASPLMSFLTPIAYASADAADVELDCILNARLFMQLPRNANSVHNKAHIDTPENHIVVIYYVNDSDGDTFVFDQSYNNTDFDKKLLITSETHNHTKITPKAGRLAIFNGARYHASSCPKENIRCVINFNLKLISH
jgi:hypothetical protein